MRIKNLEYDLRANHSLVYEEIDFINQVDAHLISVYVSIYERQQYLGYEQEPVCHIP